MRVLIPFGPRKITGFVAERTAESEFAKLKEVIDVLDLTPVLTKELLELGKWLSNQTLCLYITAFQAMLPQVLKAKYDKEIVRLTEETLSAELEFLFAGNDSIPYEKVTNSTISYYQLQKSIENGDIVVHYLVKSQVDRKSTRLNSSHVAISYAVFC